MEELNTSYLQEVALNHTSRLNNIKKEINSKQCFALKKNEERSHLQLGLYYLIKNKYTVVLKNRNGNKSYQVKDIERLSILSNVHKNTPAIKALFNDASYDSGVSVLFRLCIALGLNFEESYDWFRLCGYELNSTIHRWRNISYLLIKYTANPEHDLYNVRKKIEEANTESIANCGERLCPKSKDK